MKVNIPADAAYTEADTPDVVDHGGLNVRGALLLIGTLACLVVWSMASFIRLANADALLFSLMSTQRLTFFYWGQDRLANVVPLLASPVSDEFANFYLQMAVMGASFFVLIMMLAWFHASASGRPLSARGVALSTLIAGLVVTSLFSGLAGYRFVFEQQYVLTFVLYLFGIRFVVGDAAGLRLVGALLVVVSILIIPSSMLLLPFVWVLSSVGTNRVRRVLLAGGVTLAGFVVVSIASSLFYDGPSQSSVYNDFSIGRLRRALPVVLDNIADSVRIAPVIGLTAAALTMLVLRRRFLPDRLRAAYVSSVVFAIGWMLAFSANGWVEANLFGFRYFFPVYGAIIFVITGGIVEAVLTIKPSFERAAESSWLSGVGRRSAAMGVVLGLAVAAGGVRLRANGGIVVLDEVDADVQAIAALDVEAVVGGYWRVWPTVFAARADGADVVGITFRADAIEDEVRDTLGRVDSADWPVVQILCTDVGEDDCLALVGRFTGQVWTTTDVLSSAPLLISAEPAAPLLPRGVAFDELAESGYSIEASLLPGVVGSVVGSGRVADPATDAAGFLSYGPYARLDRTEYRLSFTYSSDASIGLVDGSFDVAVDGTPIAGIDIVGTGGRQATVQLEFDGSNDGDFEFRSLWAGGSRISIDAIEIERTAG